MTTPRRRRTRRPTAAERSTVIQRPRVATGGRGKNGDFAGSSADSDSSGTSALTEHYGPERSARSSPRSPASPSLPSADRPVADLHLEQVVERLVAAGCEPSRRASGRASCQWRSRSGLSSCTSRMTTRWPARNSAEALQVAVRQFARRASGSGGRAGLRAARRGGRRWPASSRGEMACSSASASASTSLQSRPSTLRQEQLDQPVPADDAAGLGDAGRRQAGPASPGA